MGFQTVWVDDADDDGNDDGGTPQGAPQGQLPKQARAHLRSVEKERDELKQQLAEYKAGARKSTVKSVIEAKGYDPRIAAFLPNEVEASEDAVTKWLGEFADLFAVKNNQSNEGAPAVDAVAPEDVAAMRGLSAVTGTAQPVTKPQDLIAMIQSADTPEKLNAILRAQGNKSV